MRITSLGRAAARVLWLAVALGVDGCDGCKKSEAPAAKATRAPGGAPNYTMIPAPPVQASLDLTQIRLIPQEQSEWCWAASSEMVLLYLLQMDVPQCKLANEESLSAQNCCPANPNCNTSAYPDLLFTNRRVKFVPRGSALPLLQLENEIASQRPVQFSWTYNSGGAHMMVAVAYKTEGQETLIDALDPLPEKQGRHKVLTYEEYVSAETYTHDIDYYGFSKTP